MQCKRPSSKAGTTIVEVLVALVLLTIGLFGILDLFFNISNTLVENRNQMRQDGVVRERLASVSAAGYAELDMRIRQLGESADASSAQMFPGPTKTPDAEFTWNATLEREEEGDIQRIAIAVSVYGQVRGNERERKAVGYVFAP